MNQGTIVLLGLGALAAWAYHRNRTTRNGAGNGNGNGTGVADVHGTAYSVPDASVPNASADEVAATNQHSQMGNVPVRGMALRQSVLGF